jgi:hypothetical protein
MFTTMIWGSGYEMGAVPISETDYSRVYINSTAAYVKTGTYSLRVRSEGAGNAGLARYATGGATEIYVSTWVNAPGTIYTALQAILGDGKIIEVRYNVSTHTWDVYVDGVEVDTGSIAIANEQWHHLQVYFFSDDSGSIQTKIDGVSDVNYSGDTKPGTSTSINYIRQYQGDTTLWYSSYWDNFAFGTGDWGGDVRFDVVYPDADDSVEWTPSAGDNYSTVDEIPPSDADYVSAGSPALTDVYTLSDWSGSSKAPKYVIPWARAKKDVASSRALELLVSSGGSESSGGSFSITTDYDYYYEIFDEDPSTESSWADTTIDACKVGIRSY